MAAGPAKRGSIRAIAAIALVLTGCSVVGLPGSNVVGCIGPRGHPPGPGTAEHTLIVLGDFGDGSTGRNVAVAEALRDYLDARHIDPDAVLLLGDNFYPFGLIGKGAWCTPLRRQVDDGDVAAQLRDVVSPFDFLRARSITWAIPGNHDHACPHLGSLSNQENIDRWLPPDSRWGDRWRASGGLPETILDSPLLQVIAIDSTRMVSDRRFLKESVAGLEEMLAGSRARFRIVAAHHPLYANGHHDGAWFSGTFAKTLYYPSHLLLLPPFLYGGEAVYEWPYRRYRRALERVFARHPVDLFLGGHEHALELLRPAAPGQPHTLISGAASRCAKVMERENTVFGASKNGFAVIRATDQGLDVEFVGTTDCTVEERCAAPSGPGNWHLLYRRRLH